jgi:hypothetical protein
MNSPEQGNPLRLRMRIERLFRAVINKIPYFLTLVKEKTGIYGKFMAKIHESA